MSPPAAERTRFASRIRSCLVSETGSVGWQEDRHARVGSVPRELGDHPGGHDVDLPSSDDVIHRANPAAHVRFAESTSPHTAPQSRFRLEAPRGAENFASVRAGRSWDFDRLPDLPGEQRISQR